MADLKFVDQHNMVACLENTKENTEFHQIVDFLSTCSINYALTVVVISESSVRSDLLFNDEDGIACLTNDEIFENLALMGYEQLSTKLTFQKGSFSQWKFLGRVETSTDKSLGEDASKQGRNDDKTEELNLTDGADTKVIMEDKGSGEKGGSTADQVSTARPEVSAASVPVNVSAATPSTPPTTRTIFGDEDPS
ncbi:hypothetical protein Tco_1334853 [Tanacetum coccineum]